MKNLWLFVVVFTVSGCVSAEMGRSISSQDVPWIQKGKTTRAEVVQRFGAPTSEMPDWAGMHYQVTSITTTTKTANLNRRSRLQQWSRLNRGQGHFMYIRRRKVGSLSVFRSQRSNSGLHTMRMGLCKILVYRQVHKRWSAELRYLSGSSQFSCKRSWTSSNFTSRRMARNVVTFGCWLHFFLPRCIAPSTARRSRILVSWRCSNGNSSCIHPGLTTR